jgi:hypothetical protein
VHDGAVVRVVCRQIRRMPVGDDFACMSSANEGLRKLAHEDLDAPDARQKPLTPKEDIHSRYPI